MAHLCITLDPVEEHPFTGAAGATVSLDAAEAIDCRVSGAADTFALFRQNSDVVVSLGYVCFADGESMPATLKQILGAFAESKIARLKQTLVGQYVLLVKKGDFVYLFSDFMGSRNLFYSSDGRAVATSFVTLENWLGLETAALDVHKVYEFVAMRHVFYPSSLGRNTIHKKINCLYPYEYIAIDTVNRVFRVETIDFYIENHKQVRCRVLADRLLHNLDEIVERSEFKALPVAASLTGGHDSRLVAVLAADKFPGIRFRAAVSQTRPSTAKDLSVARKIARIRKVPLDVYNFRHGRDEERFLELTEGFVPAFNHSITPLLDAAGAYSLGLGGVYGSELFKAIPWNTIEEFVTSGVAAARKFLKVDDGFWNEFCFAIYKEFAGIRQHYHLGDQSDERDYIRIFNLLGTARYSSFILTAFNRTGYQLEPFSSYKIFELALSVPPALWGDHRKLGGAALVQKAAMARLDPVVARVMTYSSFRPMAPFSISSAPLYALGFALQTADWLKSRLKKSKNQLLRTDLPDGSYFSDGWEKHFIARTVGKYAGAAGL